MISVSTQPKPPTGVDMTECTMTRIKTPRTLRKALCPAVAVVATVGSLAAACAGASAGELSLKKIGNFDMPVHVASAPDDSRRLFVVEKTGRIKVLVDGKARGTFLNLGNEVSDASEQGLLSVAFAPDYQRSRLFYVNFTDRRGDTRIQEFRRSKRPNRAAKNTRRELLKIDQPYENHNGGLVLFGPDNLLYVGMGDGGGGDDPDNNAQSMSSLLGKMLRIDPKKSNGKPYGIPADNPFARGGGGRPEICAWGLRNPWRFSFSPTGESLIGDVGQYEFEEIDHRPAGALCGTNFGWSRFEGDHLYRRDISAPEAVAPIFEYNHDSGCAVIGGLVIQDPALTGQTGRYIYGDSCDSDVRSFDLTGDKARSDSSTGIRVSGLSSFGEDLDHRVFLTSLEGPVYRLAG